VKTSPVLSETPRERDAGDGRVGQNGLASASLFDTDDEHGWPVPASWPRWTHPAPHLERLRKAFAGAEEIRMDARRRERETAARARARR
jgi:hypothetical protein